MNEIYPRDSAVVYKTTVDAFLTLDDPELQLRFGKAVFQYSIYGTYDAKGSDAVVDALMEQVVFNADRTAKRYDKCQVDGAKGGRQVKVSAEEVYNYVAVLGKKQVEAAEYFGVAPKTIQRKMREYDIAHKGQKVPEKPIENPEIKAAKEQQITFNEFVF